MKRLLFSAFVLLLASNLHAGDGGGSKSALAALPIKYKDGVVKLSADNGNPDPSTWYVVAKNSSKEGAPFNISISNGQIVSERLSLNLGALIRNSSINLAKVKISSTEAWALAQKYSAGKGKTLGTVSYALEQQGPDASPIWSVWCYDQGGSYIGLIKILATNGSVVSSE